MNGEIQHYSPSHHEVNTWGSCIETDWQLIQDGRKKILFYTIPWNSLAEGMIKAMNVGSFEKDLK